MHSMVTRINNNLLYLPKRVNLKSYHHKKKQFVTRYGWILIKFIVVIISQ